ncbi:hypothetical protein FHP29_06195 [Nocardioides albidus]|uniref:Uncharacterized protein n=1 Tax=Nocardioides albidus TaxID=1517589 RepID=A0A5C4W5D7_9ACTN|nr:hypothetical protein [Nocardioides albidus]TNM43283.1 hypothetical protein FHP29_06195 [Nocardioides albidus]
MGLDAYVPCRCFQNGLTKPAPFELELDVESGHPDLRDHGNSSLWEAYNSWEATACEHEGFDYDGDWMQNWSGVRRFGDIVTTRARTICPNLVGEWAYVGNGGHVPLDVCVVMAAEAEELERVLREDSAWIASEDSGWVLDLIARLRRLLRAAVVAGTALHWC